MTSESVIHCVQDIHVKELVKRLNWSVKIRWYNICISTLMILFVYFMLEDNFIKLHYEILTSAVFFLFFCNLIYQYQLRYSYDKCLGTYELRYYLILQIISDYLALMLVVYALGSIETPIILMVVPNTILATLFFTPRQSLLITVSGLFMVILPLLLEFFQILQVISIFGPLNGNSLKTLVLSNPIILFGYVVILFSSVLFCWYLLCSITTRLIENELELEHSYQDMLRLDEEKTHATLRSTHELKAPLAAIKNYVFTINAGYAGAVNDKVAQIIDRIGKRCDYLLNNVTDIIKLGNLKSYVVSDTQFYAVNLLEFLQKFIEKNRALTHEKHISIIINTDFPILLSEKEATNNNLMIMANDENLQLIFSNLLSNAINYSHANGIININISETITDNRDASGKSKQICISVEDHGIGIEDKHLHKIFEEHFRTNNAVAFYEGGTGLGLSIVKVCSQILDAELQIESKLGQGTIVRLCFKIMN